MELIAALRRGDVRYQTSQLDPNSDEHRALADELRQLENEALSNDEPPY